MPQPLVSIIVPLYKVEKFIRRCLESVKNQTYARIECLIIEDCGPDRSLEITLDYLKENPDFPGKIIYHEHNKGLSDARNTGMRAAQGKYCYFLDSDDEITPTAIENLVAKAEETGAEMTIGEVSCINEEEGWERDIFPIKVKEDLIDGNTEVFRAFIADDYPGMACNKLMNLEFLLKNDLFFVSGLLSQDVLWSFQCAFKIGRIAIIREITYLYYFHGGSIIHNRGEKHFNDWLIISQAFKKRFDEEQNPEKKRLIKLYILRFKTLTLQLNWKGQRNENLWKKSYRAYQQNIGMSLSDYFSHEYTAQEKREDFLQKLPAALGFRIFKYRFER